MPRKRKTKPATLSAKLFGPKQRQLYERYRTQDDHAIATALARKFRRPVAQPGDPTPAFQSSRETGYYIIGLSRGMLEYVEPPASLAARYSGAAWLTATPKYFDLVPTPAAAGVEVADNTHPTERALIERYGHNWAEELLARAFGKRVPARSPVSGEASLRPKDAFKSIGGLKNKPGRVLLLIKQLTGQGYLVNRAGFRAPITLNATYTLTEKAFDTLRKFETKQAKTPRPRKAERHGDPIFEALAGTT